MSTELQVEKVSVAKLSVISNTILVILKLMVGTLIGSVSVISEAIHSAVDLLASVIALLAVRGSGRPSDADHHYGHGKLENLSGSLEALLIFLAAGWIIYEAILKLMHPSMIEQAGWGVGIMAISAVFNFIVSAKLFKVAKKSDSIALEADAWHLLTDVYTSVGVMAAMLIITLGPYFFPQANLAIIDPIAAIIVALLIIHAAYELTVKSVKDLLDASLPDEEVEWIKKSVKEFAPKIKGFHRLRTRKSGAERFIDFHIQVDSAITIANAHEITEEVTAFIKRHFPLSNVIIHCEPCDLKKCSETCLAGCLKKEITLPNDPLPH